MIALTIVILKCFLSFEGNEPKTNSNWLGDYKKQPNQGTEHKKPDLTKPPTGFCLLHSLRVNTLEGPHQGEEGMGTPAEEKGYGSGL